jgi:protein-L-isoaspartate(D-aspartate) O-methyltransferase
LNVPALSSSEERLANAIRETPRHRFFPAGIDPNTPDGRAVPLPGNRSVPPLDVLETMLRALGLEGSERVLDVGGGSGYQAALLSGLAREVVSVESDGELVRRAVATLDALGRYNVRVVHANALDGFPESAPYQGILVGAAVTELPMSLIEQLDVGGRLVIALGDADAQLIERFRKRVDSLDSTTLGPCRLDMLPCAARRPSSFPWAGKPRGGAA